MLCCLGCFHKIRCITNTPCHKSSLSQIVPTFFGWVGQNWKFNVPIVVAGRQRLTDPPFNWSKKYAKIICRMSVTLDYFTCVWKNRNGNWAVESVPCGGGRQPDSVPGIIGTLCNYWGRFSLGFPSCYIIIHIWYNKNYSELGWQQATTRQHFYILWHFIFC